MAGIVAVGGGAIIGSVLQAENIEQNNSIYALAKSLEQISPLSARGNKMLCVALCHEYEYFFQT